MTRSGVSPGLWFYITNVLNKICCSSGIKALSVLACRNFKSSYLRRNGHPASTCCHRRSPGPDISAMNAILIRTWPVYRAKSWWKSSSPTPCAPVSWAVRAARTSDGLIGFGTRGAESRKFVLELMDKSIMAFHTSALAQRGNNNSPLLSTGLTGTQGTLDQTWLVVSSMLSACLRHKRHCQQ